MKHEIINKIKEHYEHAKQKHPYFCDSLLPKRYELVALAQKAQSLLLRARNTLKDNIKTGDVVPVDVLNCEVWEINEALTRGDDNAAIEECYDAIAVLLRWVDVLEGRQALGKPKEGAAS